MHRRSLTALPVVTIILTLLLVGPASGQQSRAGDDVQYRSVCQNIIGAINVAQSQTGVAGANANSGDATEGNSGGDAEAVAEVAQAQGVSVAQVNECLNDTEKPGVKAAPNADDAQYKDNVIAATIPDKVLPNTGGMPLLGIAALGLASAVVGASVLRAGTRRRG